MIGAIKKAQKNNTLDVRQQAKMDKPATTQPLDMDLLLMVILQNIFHSIFCNGANNYLWNQFMALQPIVATFNLQHASQK